MYNFFFCTAKCKDVWPVETLLSNCVYVLGLQQCEHTACAISFHTGRAKSKSTKTHTHSYTHKIGKSVRDVSGWMYVCRPSVPIRSSVCAAAHDSILSIYDIFIYVMVCIHNKNECDHLWWGCFYRKLTIDVAYNPKAKWEKRNRTKNTTDFENSGERDGGFGRQFGRKTNFAHCSDRVVINRTRRSIYMYMSNKHKHNGADVLAMTYSRGKRTIRGEIVVHNIFSSAECFAWMELMHNAHDRVHTQMPNLLEILCVYMYELECAKCCTFSY